MAWQFDFYSKDAEPVFTCPAGSQIGDLERKIYDEEKKYGLSALDKAVANADTTLTEDQKARAVKRADENKTAGALRKAPLMVLLAQLKQAAAAGH